MELIEQPTTPDVDLMLRADAELRCLSREVIPVLRDIEAGKEPPGEVDAALAYLETMWIEARKRAAETDAAYATLSATLEQQADNDTTALSRKACRFQASVTTLRQAVSLRVTRLLAMSEQSMTSTTLSQRTLGMM